MLQISLHNDDGIGFNSGTGLFLYSLEVASTGLTQCCAILSARIKIHTVLILKIASDVTVMPYMDNIMRYA